MILDRPYPRRLVTVPVLYGLCAVLVAFLPLWVLAAAFVSTWLPGRLRGVRLLWFAIVYLGLQAAGLLAAGWLWLAAGFGRNFGAERFRARHYRLLHVLLRLLMRSAGRLFHIGLDLEADRPPDERPEVPHDDPRPLIVLSRHAGPGDSLLLVHELLTEYERRPRIVLKATLQWDPLVDVLLHRLPNRFITSARVGVTASIAALAQGIGARDALVLFPEGANFTPDRRTRGIERLEQANRQAGAARARRLRHLLAPRPGGALAAIEAAPHADVVFVAHSGLEQLSTIGDLWRGLPMDRDVRARLWTVAAEDVPDGEEARIDWLYDWWERLDDWIDATRAARG